MPRGMKTDVALVSHSLSFAVIFGVDLGSESDNAIFRVLNRELAGKCDIWQCTWSKKGYGIIVEWEITNRIVERALRWYPDSSLYLGKIRE